MKKLLTGLLVALFCLSVLSSAFAVEMAKKETELKIPSNQLQIFQNYLRSRGIRFLTFRFPLVTYNVVQTGTGPAISGEYIVDIATIRAEISGHSYIIIPSLVENENQMTDLIFSFLLPPDEYSYRINAMINTDIPASVTGTVDLREKSITINEHFNFSPPTTTTTATTLPPLQYRTLPTTPTGPGSKDFKRF